MKRNTRFAIAILTGIMMVFTMLPSFAFAAELSQDAQQNDEQAAPEMLRDVQANEFVDDDENGNYIEWNRAYNFTLYKGENLYVDFFYGGHLDGLVYDSGNLSA